MVTDFHAAHLAAIAADQKWAKSFDAQKQAINAKSKADLDEWEANALRFELWGIVRHAGVDATPEQIEAARLAEQDYAQKAEAARSAIMAHNAAARECKEYEKLAETAWDNLRSFVAASFSKEVTE